MKRAPSSRRLLFRSYLLIAGSLVLVAIVLDYGFRQLHTDSLTVQLAESAMQLVELRLEKLNDSQRVAAVQTLQTELGFPVRLLSAGQVVAPLESSGGLVEMSDSEANLSFMRYSKSLLANIQIGPFAEPDNALLDWLPPLFYLAIFAIIGMWLWPVMKDLNLISHAANKFAVDYRKPIQIEGQISTLNELAENLDDMSSQIHSLIRSQKELAGALSHEMRTPLARIKFALAVMQENQGEVAEYSSIADDVDEIDKLISTMLDYARLDHPGTELNLELTPVEPWAIACCEKVDGMGPEFKMNNNLVQQAVYMDPQLMNIALSNLLVNASRYARTKVTLTIAREDSMVCLHVDDDGPGIPEAERTNIFEPFTRIDDSRSKHTGGYGLGLAIVTRIAALHGGCVNATKNTAEGARISVRWPGLKLEKMST